MQKKSLFIFVLVVSMLLAACGCEPAGTQNNRGKMRLTVATMPSVDKVPLIVGIEKGFFAAYGLDVIHLNFQSPGDRDAALASGNLDGVMTDMVALTLYLEAGMKWKITSLVQTGFAVLASPGGGIRQLSDITPQHECGISMNGIIEYIADMAGSAGKISLPSVSGRVEQLLANQIDLTVVPEPYGSMAVQNGAVMIATDADLGIQAAVMAFDETAIDGKSDAIMAFYAGYRDSLRYLQTANPDDYIGFVTEKGEFAAEIGDVLRSMAFNPLQTPGEEQYEAIVNWMIHNGELTGGYEFAFTDIIDFSFYEAAVQH